MDTLFARRALDKRFVQLSSLNSLQRPQRGWIRAIRTALGMTATQFAQRLQVTPARVGAIEKGEVEGTLTLASLEKAAQALDCTLFYVLVPHSSLTGMVQERARQKADAITGRVNHTMLLEAQNVSGSELIEDRDELAAELIRTRLRHLWDEK